MDKPKIIRVDVDELRGITKRAASLAKDISAGFDEIDRLYENLQDHWVSESKRDSFYLKAGEARTNKDELVKELLRLCESVLADIPNDYFWFEESVDAETYKLFAGDE